jgi:MATE family multidrug resistance protein
MVGYYGGDDPTPLAAVSFASSVFFIIFITSMGLTFGITPLVGEHYAKGNHGYLRRLLSNGFILFTSIGFIATALLYAARRLFPVMGALMIGDGSDASIGEVINLALPYFDTLIWSVLPVMIWGTAKQFLEGVGNTKSAMIVSDITNIINIALNYIFIFGKCGCPAMGVYGAGLATLVSRILNPMILGAYFVCSKRYREYLSLFSRKVDYMRNALRLLKLGFPIAGQMVLEAAAFIVTGVMMGWFGAEAISANQVGNTYGNCTFMMILSLGSATTICVSHAFGRRDIEEIAAVVRSALTMAVIWGSAVIVAFVTMRHAMPLLFTENREVILLASQMLIIYATYQLSDAVQCVFVAILRGLQQVKSIAVISFVAYIVLNIPAGYIAAFHLGMGATGLIVGYIVGLSVAALLYGIQAYRYMRYLRKIS